MHSGKNVGVKCTQLINPSGHQVHFICLPSYMFLRAVDDYLKNNVRIQSKQLYSLQSYLVNENL